MTSRDCRVDDHSLPAVLESQPITARPVTNDGKLLSIACPIRCRRWNASQDATAPRIVH
jgi:hypothetical protein